MAERKRAIQLKLYVTEQERILIEEMFFCEYGGRFF